MTRTSISYKVSNGLRHGERKTLEGAKRLAQKYRQMSRNRVRITMIYFDEELGYWMTEEVQ